MLGHLGVETDVLAIADGVRQARGLAHPQRDAAAVLDLLERVSSLRDSGRGGQNLSLIHI